MMGSVRTQPAEVTTQMPLRTRIFASYLDRFGRDSIVGMDLDSIRRSRAKVIRAVPPFTWITGPVFADVTREDTRLPARDGHELPPVSYTHRRCRRIERCRSRWSPYH